MFKKSNIRLSPPILILLAVVGLEACMKLNPISKRKVDGIWSDVRRKRNIVQNCECGLANDIWRGTPKPWTVHIFVHSPALNSTAPACVGTIITSNLVAASHTCLITSSRKKLHVVDTWGYRKGGPLLGKKLRILVSHATMESHRFDSFEVERVILNTHYVLGASLKHIPLHDLALFVVKADFTLHETLRPICIPELDPLLNLVGQEPFYYGLNEDFESGRPLAEIRQSLSGILLGEFCLREMTEMDKVKQLCVHYDKGQRCKMPIKRGNPLVVKSTDGRAFLMGLDARGDKDSKRIVHHFTNIMSLVKYIEFSANEIGSKWCKAAPLQLPKPSQSFPPPPNECDEESSTDDPHLPPSYSTPLPPSMTTSNKPLVVYDRNVTSSCNCGASHKQQYIEKFWDLYIYVYNDPAVTYPLIACTGTIITSNLIVTSHQCLALVSGGAFVKPLKLVDPSKVTVMNTRKAGYNKTEVYVVEKILRNPDYDSDDGPNDIVILKLKGVDFTTHKYLRPICIPEYDEKLDLAGVEPFTYGFGGKNQDKYILELGESLGGLHFEESCNKRGLLGSVDWLCMRYAIGQKCMVPKEPGSPLILEAKDRREFLLGLNYGFNWNAKDGNAYYANVMRSVRFIEESAHKEKSKWCSSSKLLPPSPKTSSEVVNWCGPWTKWDEVDPPVTRDQSLDCECGVRNTGNKTNRIIGGEIATPREFGWMMLFEVNEKGERLPICGGSVINSRVILTAAHCVVKAANLQEYPAEDSFVVLNAHHRLNDPLAKRYKVERIISHPGYVSGHTAFGLIDYDIALLVLKEELKFATPGTDGIKPVCVPKLSQPIDLEGKTVMVSGWGYTDAEWTTLPDELKKLETPMMNTEYCRNIATRPTGSHVICAGTLNIYQDAGRGDSGGPLSIKLKPGDKYTQVGVVSYGVGANVAGRNDTVKVTFYADVQQFIRYIDYHSDQVKAKWCRA